MNHSGKRFGQDEYRRPVLAMELSRTMLLATTGKTAPILELRRSAFSISEMQRDVAVHGLALRDQARLLVGKPLLNAQADAVPDSIVVGREPR